MREYTLVLKEWQPGAIATLWVHDDPDGELKSHALASIMLSTFDMESEPTVALSLMIGWLTHLLETWHQEGMNTSIRELFI